MALTDDFFGLFRRRSVPPTESAGEPGTAIYGGYPITEEKNPKLAGIQKNITYSEMLANTTIVAAGVRFFLNLVSKAKWTVEPADQNNAAAVEVAEFVQDMMDNCRTPWPRVIRRAVGFRFHGFSIQEWTAKRTEDGRLGLLDIEPRPQVTIERWDRDENGQIRGVVQRSRQTSEEIYLPRNKLVYMVDDSLNDSPEGLGLFRHIVDVCDRLGRFELLEAYGFEIDLRGIPVGRAPLALLKENVKQGKMTNEDVESALQPLKGFLAKHIKNPKLAMLLDSMPYRGTGDQQTPVNVQHWDLSLLQGESEGAADINVAIERMNREIARVLGVEFLLLGDGAGSHALSSDKTQNFNLMVESALDELRETYRKDFMIRFLELNGIPEELWPTLNTETVQYRDIQQVTTALKDLQMSMLTPDDPAYNEVRELIGVSPIPDEMINILIEEREMRLEAETRPPPGNEPGDDDDPEGNDDGQT